MVKNHLADAGERRERIENLGAEGHVRLHGVPLVGIERAALVQNALRDGDFSDVVQHAAEANFFHFEVAHAQAFGDERGVGGHLLRVALGVVVLGVDGERERRDGIEDRLRQSLRSLSGGRCSGVRW